MSVCSLVSSMVLNVRVRPARANRTAEVVNKRACQFGPGARAYTPGTSGHSPSPKGRRSSGVCCNTPLAGRGQTLYGRQTVRPHDYGNGFGQRRLFGSETERTTAPPRVGFDWLSSKGNLCLY
ncbi:UNVERIFIED_CONTAM: hypothetical protein K2H54_008387 [Gekko kuhli]